MEAAFALFASTLSNLINSIGYILMKVGLLKCEDGQNKPFYKRWQYILGFSFIALGAFVAVGNFI